MKSVDSSNHSDRFDCSEDDELLQAWRRHNTSARIVNVNYKQQQRRYYVNHSQLNSQGAKVIFNYCCSVVADGKESKTGIVYVTIYFPNSDDIQFQYSYMIDDQGVDSQNVSSDEIESDIVLFQRRLQLLCGIEHSADNDLVNDDNEREEEYQQLGSDLYDHYPVQGDIKDNDPDYNVMLDPTVSWSTTYDEVERVMLKSRYLSPHGCWRRYNDTDHHLRYVRHFKASTSTSTGRSSRTGQWLFYEVDTNDDANIIVNDDGELISPRPPWIGEFGEFINDYETVNSDDGSDNSNDSNDDDNNKDSNEDDGNEDSDENNGNDEDNKGDYRRSVSYHVSSSVCYNDRGQPHGEWCLYYDGVNKRQQQFYDNGVKVGTWYSLTATGKVLHQISFVNGKKQGVAIIQPRKWGGLDGKLIEFVNYVDDIKQGKAEVKTVDGQLIETMNYLDGKLPAPSGRMK